jgi:hypothetical protein
VSKSKRRRIVEPAPHSVTDSDQKRDDERPAAVSLGFELDHLRHAVEGARLLTEMLDEGSLSQEGQRSLAPRAVAGILRLVECRLRHVCRAIYGGIDPELLQADHNLTVDALGHDYQDIHLIAWAQDGRFASAPIGGCTPQPVPQRDRDGLG